VKTLLTFGSGRLGAAVVDQLAIRFPDWRFVVVSRDATKGAERINLSKYVLAQWGLYPRLEHRSADVMDVDACAELIADVDPEIIFNATTPFPWWKIASLPDNLGDVADRAGPGMWAALDCVLPLKICKAIEAAERSPIFVNGCYPDLTNTFLSGMPHGPQLGIGNISNLIPGLQLAYATNWGVEPLTVKVRVIGHHFTSLNGPSTDDVTPAPYILEVVGEDSRVLIEGPSAEPFQLLRRFAKRTRGVEGQGVTVGSASTLLAHLMSGEGGQAHSPGALGLPGGYPVTIGATGGVALNLPVGISPEMAQAINERAQYFDGTQSVVAGRAIASETALAAQRQILGTMFAEVNISNCEDIARESVRTLNERWKLGLVAL